MSNRKSPKKELVRANKDRIVEMIESGLTAIETAEKIGVSDNLLRVFLREWGVKTVKRTRKSLIDDGEVYKLHSSGMSYSEIGRRFGFTPEGIRNAVYRHAEKHGLGIEKKNQTVAVILNNDKDLVIELLDSGISFTEAARKFDVSRDAFYRHVTEKWGYVRNKDNMISVTNIREHWCDIKQETIVTVNNSARFIIRPI